ncbi:ParB/RepB/Spo0J family partition protein [Massilia sp. R2A-15]|uniref:ParB/RepB/Spo0J family partition protein n=1 Tax=Massilia sp. R2A-15 TaxID=3064278 RepID=UPI002733DE1B|nr:ParB/RepB/Spo0J family partition protein [Massilia sp. R2A-15]WLI91089.1 ParB/RepB/Spo0J family partition protein [Massilia sp. R2A-15]
MALDLSMLDEYYAPRGDAGGIAARAPLSLFQEDPDNPRFEDDAEEFQLLVADVLAHGILQPIVVRRVEGGRLRIRFGARRYRAAVTAGLADAPYIVTEDPRQFDDYSQVAENQRRAPMQPLELALFAAKKIASGEQKIAVAARLGMRPSALSHLLCLTGAAPPFLLELYHARKCRTPLYLYRLLRLWRRDAPMVEAACAAATEIGAALIERLESEWNGRREVATADGLPAGGAAGGADAGAARVPGGLAPVGAPQPGPDTARGVLRGLAARRDNRVRRPLLIVTWKGREAVMRLRVRPSTEALIWVQWCDDQREAEVPCAEILVSRLVDAAK